jgi:hypothetical protein
MSTNATALQDRDAIQQLIYRYTDAEINIDQYGIYFDELAKFDNTWKFARRVFVPILIASRHGGRRDDDRSTHNCRSGGARPGNMARSWLDAMLRDPHSKQPTTCCMSLSV